MAQPNEPQGFLASTDIAAQARCKVPTIRHLPLEHLRIAAVRAGLCRIIEAITVSAAGADRERAGSVSGADRACQKSKTHRRNGDAPPDFRHVLPFPKARRKLAGKGFELVNKATPGAARAELFQIESIVALAF